MRHFFVLVVMLLFTISKSASIAAQENPSILYVGNNLMMRSQMMNMLNDMVYQNGQFMHLQKFTAAENKFRDHAKNSDLETVLKSRKWDFVILQGQSQETGFPDKQIETEVRAPAMALVQKIRRFHPRTKVVFMMTMARKYGDPMNARVVPEVGTYNGMQNRVNNTYNIMATENEAMLARVGEVWQSVRTKHPEIELYDDNVYANENGGFLTACTFYSTIFCASCRSENMSVPINEKYADDIVKIVDRKVLGKCLSS